MLKHIWLFAALSLVLSPASAQEADTPAVPGQGAIVRAPDAANQPDPAIRYRVVFDITKAPADAAEPNPGLVKMARFLNLLATRDIHPQPGDVVGVIHGPATPLVMNEAAYRTAFEVDNPNLSVIGALKRAGAQVHVCSQALHGHKIAADSVAPEVTVDLAAITTLATLQLQGFALIPD